ncbi:MAG: hypothetical protein PHI12_14705 [Dehalococcoidales bacterium]|nr:hypothetical protein [Dehalococcoidales bacterium]
MKIYIAEPQEIKHCGDCPNCGHFGGNDDYWCAIIEKTTITLRDKVPDLWGEIPAWCPLPDKGAADGL